MKKIYVFLALGLTGTFLLMGFNRSTEALDGFVEGTPEVKSISAITFGDNGMLFIGDSKSASVYAIDTKDIKSSPESSVEIESLDVKIAALLGTQVQNIDITDVAVNRASGRVYVAVQSADGTPVLLRTNGNELEAVSLQNVSFSTATLMDAPAEDATDDRGRSLRTSSISDIGFSNGKVLVSGLSNKEFSSSLRSIAFPFTNNIQNNATLEIWHAAHGRFETESPIRTFTTAMINGREYLVASYTCTPLVLFPMDELTGGKHIKGRTIAEMGSSNSPLDMTVLSREGKSYLMLSNSNRPVFKVKFTDIESFEDELTQPIQESYATGGVDFLSLPVVNVIQMDKFDDARMVFLQRKANGNLDLYLSSERML